MAQSEKKKKRNKKKVEEKEKGAVEHPWVSSAECGETARLSPHTDTAEVRSMSSKLDCPVPILVDLPLRSV